MQAIILAAGMGKRLGAKTKDNTKCMVEVNGVRLIDRLLHQLSASGIHKVVIVVGYQSDNLKSWIADRYEDMQIIYVDNPVYDRTNNIYSLWLAADYLRSDDTLLLESDVILDDSVIPYILSASYPNLALVDKYESWMDGTVVRLNKENDIVNFIPKKGFDFRVADNYYKTVNVYKFSKSFSAGTYVPFLEAYTKSVGVNEYYEQVLRVISALDRRDFKALPMNGRKWYEIDDLQDLDNAETLFEEDSSIRLAKYMRRYGGYWRYPGLKDFCYLVNPYFPSDRMVEEMMSQFRELLTSYPSGLGMNSLLSGKCFSVRPEYICPGNGASELISALMSMLTGRIGMISPSFEEYGARLKNSESVVYVPEREGFAYNVEDIVAYFADKHLDTLLLINPDNPSGNYIPYEDLQRLAKWCGENGIRLVLDESFVDFQDNENASMLSDRALETYPSLVVIKSISKSYGVPGLRLGVLASSDTELVGQIRKAVPIWNINSFAEFYMQIYNKYEHDYMESCRKIRLVRDGLYEELCKVPYLRPFRSASNYFLCEVDSSVGASALALKLLSEYNILIKDCSAKKGFDGRDYVRIAVRNEEDNAVLLNALRSISLS